MAQYDTWLAERRGWADGHGVDEDDHLDLVDAEPWDDDLPHAGVWSREPGGDGVTCREHGLTPGQH